MSHIGNQIITIPAGVTITLKNRVLTVIGPKGALTQTIHPLADIKIENSVLAVTRHGDSHTKAAESIHGLTRALIANLVSGVTTGFTRRLELVGTGYRVTKKGTALSLTLGFSHPVEFPAVPGLTFDIEGNNAIIVSGFDKQLVHQIAANIRAIRPPEPYKGKGIHYSDEKVRRKPGKQAKTAT